MVGVSHQALIAAYGAAAANLALRFTGAYTINFGGTGSATATVPAVDLGAADATKQIIVFNANEANAAQPTSVTIDGVTAGMIVAGGDSLTAAMRIYSATYTGSGPFNIVVSVATTSTEISQVIVYEVTNAAPAYEGARQVSSNTAATLMTLSQRLADGAMMVGGVISNTDTITATWSGLTEDRDADAGDHAISIASKTTAAAGKTDLAVTMTPSASSICRAAGLALHKTGSRLRGGFRCANHSTIIAVGATSVTIANATLGNKRLTDYTGLGSFKLLLFIGIEANCTITGVTFNGNAMTSVGSVTNTGASPDLTMAVFSIDVTQGAPSGDIVVSFSASITGTLNITPACMYNVSSVGTPATATANAASAGVTLTVTDGNHILAAHIRSTDTQTITWTGVNKCNVEGLTSAGGITANAWSAADWPDANAETNRAITPTGSASGQCATIAVALS